MKWIIIAFLYWEAPIELDPHIIVNNIKNYSSYEECHRDMIGPRKLELQRTIEVQYPKIKSFSIRCMSYQDALQLLKTAKPQKEI